jgi:hypothetical protein
MVESILCPYTKETINQMIESCLQILFRAMTEKLNLFR